MTKHILSVDGGGIRGIIPAIILAEIEKRARRPIAEMFDLMAGTSTGGIVVAGLCKKDQRGNPQYSANDLVEVYQKYGAYVFKSSFFKQAQSWVLGAQYPCKNIESILEKYFGDDILKNTLSKVLITSYDIQNNCPFFFKSWKEDSNFLKLIDVLRATTAAPTYFAPKYLEVSKTERVLIDGGVFANHPAACAYASGRRLFPNDNIILLSIGTGRTTKSITNSKILGKIGWIKPLLHIIFASGLDCVNYQMNRVIGDGYFRIQGQLKLASDELDNATPKNIKYLQQEANAMIENNRELIDKFLKFQANSKQKNYIRSKKELKEHSFAEKT